MAQSFQITATTTLGLALLTIAVPGPIMLDMLGAGLASLGLGMIYEAF